jgi:hypothetical protein
MLLGIRSSSMGCVPAFTSTPALAKQVDYEVHTLLAVSTFTVKAYICKAASSAGRLVRVVLQV